MIYFIWNNKTRVSDFGMENSYGNFTYNQRPPSGHLEETMYSRICITAFSMTTTDPCRFQETTHRFVRSDERSEWNTRAWSVCQPAISDINNNYFIVISFVTVENDREFRAHARKTAHLVDERNAPSAIITQRCILSFRIKLILMTLRYQ